MPRRRVQNWKRSITYHANSVERIKSVEQLQEIVKDKERYPSPVRAKGSHHSTTRCIVAEGGTVVDFSKFNEIVEIDKDAKTITMQAGVQQIDAAKALEKEGLQFFTNIELGNLTMGSGATGGTKDAQQPSPQALIGPGIDVPGHAMAHALRNRIDAARVKSRGQIFFGVSWRDKCRDGTKVADATISSPPSISTHHERN